MRQKVTALMLEQFMKSLGAAVKSEARVYLVGGATAVLMGWRDSTIDVDLKIVPDSEIPRNISDLKERLQINIELASPDDFIPVLPGWQDRSAFIRREGRLDFLLYKYPAIDKESFKKAVQRVVSEHAGQRS